MKDWGILLLLSLVMTSVIAGSGQTAVADDLETSVGRMAKIGSCSSARFSPDGMRLAFISNLSGIPQVWMIASGGGFPEQVTAFDDLVTGLEWSPDGEWLALSIAPGGGLNEQVYLVRPDGSGLRRLTSGGKENNRLGTWSHDGKSLIMGSNRRDAATFDALLVDPATGSPRLSLTGPGINSLTDLSRDGRWGLLSRVVSRGDNNLYLVDLATRAEIRLTPHVGPGSFSGSFSPDSRSVYLLTNKDRDVIAFGRIRLSASGEPGPIELLAVREDGELQAFELDEPGTTAALVWNVAGRSEIEMLDLRTLKSTAGPRLPAELASSLQFSRDGRLLAMTLAGAASPQDVWVLDRSTGNLKRLTSSPHAGIDLAQLVRPELVRFKAHDGLELSGWLYRPRNVPSPGPVVLSFHGGPEGQERPVLSSTYQALLAQGIGVFAPNVRGSSGFGKRFVNLDNGALRVNGVKDIKACVDYVVSAGVADPKRLGIMGGSYGGYMTMAGLTEYPQLFAAGADLFGVVNFETFFAHTEPWMAAISKVEYGDPATEVGMLRELSPIHRVDRVIAPTIVLHGANDTNVPVVEAEQVVESLKRRGVPVEYILFPDEGHGFRKTTNRIRSTVALVRWFVKHLRPETRS